MEPTPTAASPAASQDRQFSALVRKRWTVSLTLTVLMLAIYYGFIAILAFRADIFATRVGEHMTLGIPVGLGVIIASWLLTGIYVRWANDDYDAAVKTLKHAMRGNQG